MNASIGRAGAAGNWVMRAVMLASLVVSLLVLSAPTPLTPEADAAVSCDASSEATLNACIATYNSTAAVDGPVDITLVNDIVLSNPPTPIDNALGTDLNIMGDGFTISAGTGFPSVSDIFVQERGSTSFTALTVTGATDDAIDIRGGTATVAYSTFVGNAFGLCACDGVVTVTNSTIADNSFDGIYVFLAGSIDVDLTTIVDNGRRGIGGSGTISVTDSLIAGNAEVECGSAFIDGGGNVVEDVSCGPTATPEIAGTYATSLADNGCFTPCTQTIALLPGSPAIDAAGSCSDTIDQRATGRDSGLCDAGAFELGDCVSPFAVDSEAELNFAIGCHNLAAAASMIEIDFVGDVEKSNLAVFIDNATGASLVIDGNGHELRPATGAVTSLLGQTNGSTTIDRLTVRGGTFDAVSISGGTLAVRNSTFTENDGGLGVHGAQATVVNSTFVANDVFGLGADGSASVEVVSSTFVDNNRGVSSVAPAIVSLTGTLIAGNTAGECSGDGTITDLGGNVVQDGSCGSIAATPSVAGTFAPSLAENGCTAPCTQTIALNANSPAIDAAGTCAESFDQRGVGFPRTAGAACDAGAFEAAAVPCSAGTYSATGEQPCTPAPIGSYVPGAGATSATPCAAGTWSYSSGATSCGVLPLCDGKKVTIVWSPSASATNGADVILGTTGNDTIDASGGNDTVCAGGGNDLVVGGDGDDRLFGEGGRDILRGNTGSDHVDGGPGDDRVLGGIGNDAMFGRDGDDYLGGFGGDDTIDGGPGDETIFGGFGADTISGGAGNDTIRGLIGNDTIDGGAGNDVLDGDAGSDTIAGGPGADIVNGGNAADVVRGNGGNDSVNGGRADDLLSGGPGNDVCTGNKHFAGDTTDGSCETVFGVP